ncbi:Uncharacterised protein [Serratia fonticola]|uniref:Uncharacterized protein n=1 Tax=Serratia fonticola TaxID=47917 RepID=A0A4U9UPU0_SERFO|nr:Uncharacterised protein [Serratia fonticola]
MARPKSGTRSIAGCASKMTAFVALFEALGPTVAACSGVPLFDFQGRACGVIAVFC